MKLTTKLICAPILLIGTLTHTTNANAAVSLMCYLAASQIDAYANGAPYNYLSTYWYNYYNSHC